MIQEKIKNLIKEALKNLEVEDLDFVVEHPADLKMGDYSTNVAMALAKKLKMNPRDLAEKIKNDIEKNLPEEIEKVEVAGAGFINFYLAPKFFRGSVEEILDNPNFGENQILNGEKIIIEYTVTNVLKPMHIGHLMGNIIGESLSRIIGSSGAEIKRNNYQGDSGLHVAKAVWGIKKLSETKPIPLNGSISEKSNYIGAAYELGSTSYDIPDLKTEIDEVNKKIFNKTDIDLLETYQWGRQVSLDHFEELYKKLGTKFDLYFFESEVAPSALKIVREFLKKGLFEESNGAVIFHGEKYNPKLHTRVFITDKNLPTYEAKDIAHALRKYDEYKFDKAIIVTANEQDEYFKVVLCALNEINSEIAKKIKHLSHGLLKLGGEKMASRKGNVITGEGLINTVEDRVLSEIKDREFSDEERKKVSESVAIAAIKYSILRQAVGGDIIFDFEKSISFEGDSGPYLQYSYARANSIVEKAKKENILPKSNIGNNDNEIFELEKILYRFPEIVERSAREYEPHYIANYLIEIARAFNSFYGNNIIVNKEDKSSAYKVALTSAFSCVMKKGLNLLGIEAPEKM